MVYPITLVLTMSIKVIRITNPNLNSEATLTFESWTAVMEYWMRRYYKPSEKYKVPFVFFRINDNDHQQLLTCITIIAEPEFEYIHEYPFPHRLSFTNTEKLSRLTLEDEDGKIVIDCKVKMIEFPE